MTVASDSPAVFDQDCRVIQPSTSRLSVNLNKIALLRNSRRTGVPDILHFVEIARAAGADGITVHPRPDERHILRDDVLRIAELIEPWRPDFEFNIEGYPDERFSEIVRAVRPEQCTLVPDPPDVLTSEEGWKLGNEDIPFVSNAVLEIKKLGARVILFLDPDATVVQRVTWTGADGIEIYTGSYAAAFRAGRAEVLSSACAAAARCAADLGLSINIGHDLNLENLPPLVRVLPALAEASIGHELTADALVMGFGPAVAAYKAALTGIVANGGSKTASHPSRTVRLCQTPAMSN